MRSGADLSAGPFYVASYRVQIFIPLSSIDAGDGDVGNDAGGLTLYNRVGDFDPDGVSGASNFGSGREPGWCDPMSVDGNDLNAEGMPFCDPSGTNTTPPAKSDNVAGPTSFTYGPGRVREVPAGSDPVVQRGLAVLAQHDCAPRRRCRDAARPGVRHLPRLDQR
ncbi:MAG: hypothetical protein V9E81_17165 [Marmoricola sp.]